MTAHINRFVDRLRQAENRQHRDLTLSITEARDLHADITRLLLALEQLRTVPNESPEQSGRIEVSGGQF